MTKTIFMAVIAAVAVMPSAALAAPANIVVVDTERVYNECTACKSAVTQLRAKGTQLQSRQQALANPLRTEAQAIQTAINALQGKQPDAALKARVEAYQKKEATANQELARLQEDLQSTQVNVRRQIDARLTPIYSQVMQAKGANLAIEANSTLARGQALDVTADVLAALNQQLPAVSVTPMPKAAATQSKPQGR